MVVPFSNKREGPYAAGQGFPEGSAWTSSSVLPENLLKVPIPGSHIRLTKSETLNMGLRLAICVLISPPGDSNVYSGFIFQLKHLG